MFKSHKVFKAVSAIIIFSFLSKVLAFVRDMIIAKNYGVSWQMDAYSVAQNIPTVLLVGLGLAITTTFIPAFTKKRENEGQQSAFEFSRKLLTLFSIAGFIICLIGIIFAPGISHLMAPKFACAKLMLTARLTRIMLITGAFTIISGLLVGLQQAMEEYTIPALLGIPANLTIIIAVAFFAGKFGIYALAIGTALSVITQVLFQIPNVKRMGFNFKPSFNLFEPEIYKIATLIIPVFASTMLLQVNNVVDKIFASGLPVGSIAAVSYAGRVTGLIISIVALAISTVTLPVLSKSAASRDMNGISQTMLKAVQGINFLVIPMTVGMVVLRIPLVQLLFERGAFGPRATAMTSLVLLYLSLGLFSYGLRDIFSRVFFSLQDTLTPMINSGITIVLNIILMFFLVPRFGLAGLAGATSLSGVFGGVQLLFWMKKRIGIIHAKEIGKSFMKVTVSSLVMGFFLNWFYPLFRSIVNGNGLFEKIMTLGLATLMGLIVYVIGLYIFRAEELHILQKMVRTKKA